MKENNIMKINNVMKCMVIEIMIMKIVIMKWKCEEMKKWHVLCSNIWMIMKWNNNIN